MRDPSTLLFHSQHIGGSLFKSQLDLAQKLLSHPESPYYIADVQSPEYARELNNLKAYLSQLLSGSVNRTITPRFLSGLTVVLKDRLKNSQGDPVLVRNTIISALKNRNLPSKAADSKVSFIDQVYADLAAAKYIAVVSSRPLEISGNLQEKPFSFQKFFIEDLMASFFQPGKVLKKYRFNFPLIQYAEIFWKELRKIIVRIIIDKQHEASLHVALFRNYLIKGDQINLLKDIMPIENDDAETIANNILLFINGRNRLLLVFVIELPIYSMPIIALDPDDPLSSKIYAVLDTSQQVIIHKYAQEDYLLWRLFVWDKLKTNVSEIIDAKYLPRQKS